MGDEILKRLKIHFDLSFEMMARHVDNCPDGLWDAACGGFVFWQQVLHALTGTLYWTRSEKADFVEPFRERNVYPELERAPVGKVSKAELRELATAVGRQADALLDGKNDAWLLEPNVLYGKIANFDVIQGQIRHLLYHAGHCDSALRERNESAVEWIEYYG